MKLIKLICNLCGKEYNVKPYRKLTSKYCSKSCASKATYQQKLRNIDQSYKIGNQFAKNKKGKRPKNAFPKGHIPWNKNLKGIHLSPDTEFKKGNKNSQKTLVGTIRERTDKSGKKRNFIKIENPNNWIPYYKYLWEQKNGKVPKGYVIHHINKKSNDDRIENLKILTRKQHINIHRQDLKNNGMLANGQISFDTDTNMLI